MVLLGIPALIGEQSNDAPRTGERVAGTGGVCRLAGPASTGAKCVLRGELIPVNRAKVADLTVVPGIGPVLASRIIDARSKRGGFTAFEDILEVKGIGPKRLVVLRRYLTVDSVENPTIPP